MDFGGDANKVVLIRGRSSRGAPPSGTRVAGDGVAGGEGFARLAEDSAVLDGDASDWRVPRVPGLHRQLPAGLMDRSWSGVAGLAMTTQPNRSKPPGGSHPRASCRMLFVGTGLAFFCNRLPRGRNRRGGIGSRAGPGYNGAVSHNPTGQAGHASGATSFGPRRRADRASL